MAPGTSRDNGRGDRGRGPNGDPYRDLSRENREGHERVERSLKEADRIANTPRRDAPRAPAR